MALYTNTNIKHTVHACRNTSVQKQTNNNKRTISGHETHIDRHVMNVN